MRVLEELGAADASVGWTVMIGACSWCDLVGLPRTTFDTLFGGGDAITAGAFAPSGTATPVDGGYRVSGRWGFVSGCEHATLVFGNTLEQPGPQDPGDQHDQGGGPPPMRIAVFSPDEIEIEDTWDVAGLRGTGSHHVRADDVFVPAARTLATMVDPPCVDEPVTRLPIPTAYALPMANVALGVARSAVDDIVALASVEVVAVAYRAGGGSSLYAASPLQRWLRDINALAQHFLVKPATLATAGAVLAGPEVDLSVF